MAVYYEWDVEEYYVRDCKDAYGSYESGEIKDHDYHETAFEAIISSLKSTGDENTAYRLSLVRVVGSDWEGETDRGWAYINDMKLPKVFLDGCDRWFSDVPKKCVQEWEKAVKKYEMMKNEC